MANARRVKVGAEELLAGRGTPKTTESFALITNHTAVVGEFRWLVYELRNGERLRLKLLLAPGHGLYGDRDGEVDGMMVDEKTGLTVLKLGSYIRNGLAACPKEVSLDAIIWDVQDAGVRHFTFWIEMVRAMQRAARDGLTFIVLDRPNPLGGEAFDGPTVDESFRGYLYGLKPPIPIRHGLTMGEMCLMMNHLLKVQCDLKIVKMKGWKRKMLFAETGLPWVPLTPNLPTADTLSVYPGTSLLEGTNVSEGRGTTRPFETVGAPWVKAHEMAEALNAKEMKGVVFRPAHFIPMLHPHFPMSTKHASERCGGVQVHVLDAGEFEPVRTGLEIISFLKTRYDGEFQWDSSHYFRDAPVPDGVFYFDTLVGTPKVREWLEAGRTVDEIVVSWKEDLRKYSRRRADYLLY